jgi:hypothetical protein
MAALAVITPTNGGVLSTGVGVASTDTIDQGVMGPNGVILEIINGNALSDAMTISDAGATPAGNGLTGGTIANTVANATSEVHYIKRSQVTPATGLVTITHSVTTTVTYKMYAY